MQYVQWGEKKRRVDVPEGFVFLRGSAQLRESDWYFNRHTGVWELVDSDDVGLPVGLCKFIACREVKPWQLFPDELDNETVTYAVDKVE